jgi:DNA polymerase-4
MFGVSFGTFLYRAVRGEPAETFGRERGSHSMSAAHTFEYDLFDEFAIETILMEICQTLFFRLISSGSQSTAVSLKIRYGDFTTEGIRETFRNPILTVNDFYAHVLDLFHKKYRKGKGIRLIGAGLINLTREDPTRQGELFDTGNEKERRLEKSILKINEKYPNAALHRSRSTLAP